MTKLEALAKDCIKNHTHRLVDKPTKQDIYLREESIFIQGYRQSEKRIEELEAENERIKTKYYELQETLKKVRIALIKERTANIMTYNKGGVEIFDDMFEILKGVSN